MNTQPLCWHRASEVEPPTTEMICFRKIGAPEYRIGIYHKHCAAVFCNIYKEYVPIHQVEWLGPYTPPVSAEEASLKPMEFDAIKDAILHSNAKSEYKQACIVIMRGIFSTLHTQPSEDIAVEFLEWVQENFVRTGAYSKYYSVSVKGKENGYPFGPIYHGSELLQLFLASKQKPA